jgi:hypothetical protein
MQICNKCKIKQPINNFYRNYKYYIHEKKCKKCRANYVRKWRKNNPKRYNETVDKYNNSERGFLVNLYNSVKKRSKKRNNRKTIEVNLTMKEFFEEWLLHKQRYGITCRYTGFPLTHSRKGRHPTNISVDRIDNCLPYQVNNIVFCSITFNDRKGSVEIEDCKRILKVYEERKLELEEDGYYDNKL